MANNHFEVKILSRSKTDRSAPATAAYRAGILLTNEEDGESHDFRNKGGVVYSKIMLPENAPPEYDDPSTLWNAVQAVENSKNSQLLREIIASNQVEFSEQEQIEITKEYCKKFVDEGMIVSINIHRPDRETDNPHTHYLLTMRPINEDGTWGNKQTKEYILDNQGQRIYDSDKRQYQCRSIPTTDWNLPTNAEKWRSDWHDINNKKFEEKGLNTRLSTQSKAFENTETADV